MVVEARRRPEVSMPAELTVIVDRVQEIGSGRITVTQGDASVLYSRNFGYDIYDGVFRTPYLYAGRTMTMIDIDNVGLSKEATLASVRDQVTGIKGVISSVLPRYISTGRVDVANFPAEYPLPSSQVADLKVITSGNVDVTILGSNIMLPVDLQAIYYSPVIAISTGYVGAGETKVSDPIDVDTFRTKTIQGWAEFDGEIAIETAMLANKFNPYPYYKTTISSGTTFTLSFTEVVSQVRIKLTNTSTTTGLAFVAVGRAVV